MFERPKGTDVVRVDVDVYVVVRTLVSVPMTVVRVETDVANEILVSSEVVVVVVYHW